jgi:NADH:ubiquinone oxidoreductase subunit 6 (subunit J)
MEGLKTLGAVLALVALVAIFIFRTVHVASMVTRGFHESGSSWWINLALTLALVVGIVAVIRAARSDWQRKR